MRLLETALALALSSLSTGCCAFGWLGWCGPAHVSLEELAQRGDALAISDALEELIESGKATSADYDLALEAVRAHAQPTAAYAFARAAVTGRVVQLRGLGGAGMIGEVEKWALASKTLDPNFREGAATRLLGSLYVLAPSSFLEHGDSETGFELLEGLVKAHPATLENHLRLAEAYVKGHDVASATPYLCRCVAGRIKLRKDEQHLLDSLLAEAGNPACPGSSSPAAPAAPAASPPPAPTTPPIAPPPPTLPAPVAPPTP